MRKTIVRVGFLFLAILFVGNSATAQTVSGSIADGTVKRGGSAKGTIVLNVPAELHVNSNSPESKYAIPTTVKLSANDVRLSSVSYPKGKTKKFGFSEVPVNVYEGKVEFSFNVTVPANFKGNSIEVKANVRFQACNDEVCFPPRTREVIMTARVR
jgi:DsbC/DsbD-like thiol-disulfide interchange protein